MLSEYPALPLRIGSHVCILYRDDTTLLEFLVPFIVDGLRKSQKCFCAQRVAILKRLPSALAQAGVSVEEEVERGALELHADRDVYLKDGAFLPEQMMHELERTMEKAKADGFYALRTAGDLGWAMSRPTQELLRYEQIIHERYPMNDAIGLCQYPMNGVSSGFGDELRKLHHASLVRRESNLSCVSIREGDYAAEIVGDSLNPEATFNYVVQNCVTRTVTGWGTERSSLAAIEAAMKLILQQRTMN